MTGAAAMCNGALAHLNPTAVVHGGPLSAVRHVGDLGNVTADAGGAVDTTFTDAVISLRAGDAGYILGGRSITLHAFPDDGGVGRSDGGGCGPAGTLNCTSNTTGNAGGRLACAAIVPSLSAAGGSGGGGLRGWWA